VDELNGAKALLSWVLRSWYKPDGVTVQSGEGTGFVGNVLRRAVVDEVCYK